MSTPEADDTRRRRRAALVVAGSFVAWIAVQWLGGALGWPPAFALVVDLAAIVALGWAAVELLRLRRARQDK